MAERGQLEVAGQRLEYLSLGAAPELVLLHEGLGCVSQWRDFPERLAAASGRGVFAYSRAGYGGSSPCALPRPLSYMEEEAEEVLPALLDAIGFRGGVLLGHSDGASIAAVYAGSQEDPRLEGLILIAPHFFTEPEGLAAIAEARVAYERGELRDRLAKHHGANVDTAFWGWNRAWLDPDFAAWDITRFLPRITVPTLILQGAADQYGTLRQIEAARAQMTCRLEVEVLADCRHAPQREQPERTLAAIQGFLSA